MPDLDVQAKSECGAHDQQLASLIANVARGNEQALGLLYDQTSSHVYGLAFRVLNDPMLAEEVTMDVYMQVWRQAGEFDQKRGKPIVWLTVLVRSRAIDRLRSGQKEREHRQSLDTIENAPTTKASPEESSAYGEQRRVLQQALASLTYDQRSVIEMAYFGGLTQREISVQIGEPLGTVKTRVRLGMIKLRNILGPLEEGLIS
ncbi:MAG: DNA-directed RNA polymerase sigma-70 factor [Nitrospirales bacterium]|nr:MAG: DNA-directed RNA polymerase sigma-70 factor [Nitrospirales bacterium]